MIIVPRQALPEDDRARAECLRNYFTEQMVSSVLGDDGWALTLNWPTTADYYIDSRLLEGLSWWSNDLSVEGISSAVREEGGWQLSLNDSWTLLSWSRWLVNCWERERLPSEIVVLHVDDHDDLMSPRLWSKADSWVDAIAQQQVDLLQPETISAAIESGAIGIGSFIVPLLHQIPKVHIRHLCATGYSISRKGKYLLQPITAADELLDPSMLRPAVRLVSVPNQKFDAASTYSVTAHLDDWLQGLPDVPILLHIDLDYFNNRFNGDSDWELHPSRHDPSAREITNAIDAVFNALAKHSLDRIEDITVALSPRFFPAEFWPLATERIHHNVDRLGLSLVV